MTIHRDMPYEVYAELDGMNLSKLKPMRNSPLDYIESLNGEDDDNAARQLYRYEHALVLEPETVADSFVEWVGEIDAIHATKSKRGDIQTSTNSNAYKRFKQWADAAGLSVINRATESQQRDYDEAHKLARRVRNHPDMALALATGQTELVVIAHDEELGRVIKCRIDLISPAWWLDMKHYGTTEGRMCGQLAYRNGGVHQAAFNLRCIVAHNKTAAPEDVLPIPEQWGLMCVRTKPVDVSRRTIDPNDMAAADKEIVEWFRRLAECEATNEWPGHGDGMLDLPGYAFAPDINDFTFGEE